MTDYYKSQYLNIIKLDKSALLFNGATGCLDEVSPNLGGALDSAAALRLDFLSKDDIAFLEKRGHITPLAPTLEKERFKELAGLLHDSSAKREKASSSIMLLMSYNCNLNCSYCYQKQVRNKRPGAVMSERFIEKLFDEHFPKLFPGLTPEKTSITFYGGEPFLKEHQASVEKVLSYAAVHGIYCGAISNATRIEHYADKMGPHPGQINFVQVSFDGDKNAHNKSRIGPEDQATFDKIISNLHLLLNKKVRVNVRINMDVKRLESLDGLLKYLEEQEILHHPQAYVYIHPLHNHFNQTDDATFMTTCQLSEKLSRYPAKVRHPIARRADGLRYLMQIQQGIALNKTSFCMQCMENSYVIDPFGDIYGCYEEAGREEFKIGQLDDNGVSFLPLKETYLKRHIANMPKCLGCSIALACGGCCGTLSREKTGNIYEPFCDDMKEMVLESIKHLYKEKYVAAVPAAAANQGLSQPHL